MTTLPLKSRAPHPGSSQLREAQLEKDPPQSWRLRGGRGPSTGHTGGHGGLPGSVMQVVAAPSSHP